MAAWKRIALVVIIASVVIGSVAGFLQQDTRPLSQKFSFAASAVDTDGPVACFPVPKNFTDWLKIGVIGNRTGINFQQVSVFAVGSDISIRLPLNNTYYSLVSYEPVNSTLEFIYVPLPTYWNAGDELEVSIAYFITGYTPSTQNIGQVPIKTGGIEC